MYYYKTRRVDHFLKKPKILIGGLAVNAGDTVEVMSYSPNIRAATIFRSGMSPIPKRSSTL